MFLCSVDTMQENIFSFCVGWFFASVSLITIMEHAAQWVLYMCVFSHVLLINHVSLRQNCPATVVLTTIHTQQIIFLSLIVLRGAEI